MIRPPDERHAAAISSARSTPLGVSIMHQMARRAGEPERSRISRACCTVWALSTLGNTTASIGIAAADRRSARPHGVDNALTLKNSSRAPYPPEASARATLSRAAGFASGTTASSRSKIRPSAPRLRAFSSARALDAGMNRTERLGRDAADMRVPSGCTNRGRIALVVVEPLATPGRCSVAV
jgi:hypothetical protein